jgi:membrane-bound lytic murein transglycosylase D
LLFRHSLPAAALLLICAISPANGQSILPLVSALPDPVADSLAAAFPTSILVARAAYQAAWTQRQAEDYTTATETCDIAIKQIDAELTADVDASTRRELVDLRSKLSGLREAANHQIGSSRREAADATDPQVLNAPATDDIQPQYNADVYRWIEFYTGAGRSVFERWLKRSGRYMELFRTVLQKEGLPPDLVHLVFVESGFNITARSHSAAVGPWQFLRSTARLFGLTVNQWVDERRDPEKSTVAAARYLKHLYAIFGDWPLALASYNAGEGTVLRAIKRQGTTNYWDLRLPAQTEEYVPQFMAMLAISREPKKYGFDDVEQDEPMNFDELALTGAVDLRAIAGLAGCDYEEIRLLNPAVLRHAAPGRDGVAMIRVPHGKAEVIMSRLQDGAALPAVNLTVQHRVQRGETLQRIADQYHVSAQQLARANHISRVHPLKRGTVLTVPAASIRPPAAASLPAGDPRGSTAYVPARDLPTPASLKAESDAEGRMTHRVKKGETLAGIAAMHNVSVEDIRRWNHLNATRLRRGTRLKIRTGDAAVPSPEVVAADSAQVAALKPPTSSRRARRSFNEPVRATVTVQAGETLGVLAARHGTTVERIKAANGLMTSRIRAGQRLRIPS